jgi:hypothetical protein
MDHLVVRHSVSQACESIALGSLLVHLTQRPMPVRQSGEARVSAPVSKLNTEFRVPGSLARLSLVVRSRLSTGITYFIRSFINLRHRLKGTLNGRLGAEPLQSNPSQQINQSWGSLGIRPYQLARKTSYF